jgi:hypothetical protein
MTASRVGASNPGRRATCKLRCAMNNPLRRDLRGMRRILVIDDDGDRRETL